MFHITQLLQPHFILLLFLYFFYHLIYILCKTTWATVKPKLNPQPGMWFLTTYKKGGPERPPFFPDFAMVLGIKTLETGTYTQERAVELEVFVASVAGQVRIFYESIRITVF